jgi:hypothetical protein
MFNQEQAVGALPWWRLARQFAVVSLAGLLLAEAVCRYALGLGDPPLVIRDHACGYRFAPSQSVHRFGNRVSYDHRSMRGRHSAVPANNAYGVLVVGDSVLNGGSLTDDADTAGALLNDMSIQIGGRHAAFRNLSAGSWAPPQQLAYLRTYDTGPLDSVVFVLSSHDATGRHVGDSTPFPTRRPWLAAEELVFRYLFQYHHHFLDPEKGWQAAAAGVPEEIAASSDPSAVSCWCLKEICGLCRNRKLPLAVVLWPTRAEVEARTWDKLCHAITDVLAREGVAWVDLMPQIRHQADSVDRPYRDNIHPTVAGQRILAGGVMQAAFLALGEAKAY